MVEQILIRCGRYLEEFDASDNPDAFYSTLVVEYCKNIQYIKGFEFSSQVIEKLALNCKNVLRLLICNPRICENEKEDKKLEEAVLNLIFILVRFAHIIKV